VPYQSTEKYCDLLLLDYTHQEPLWQSLPDPEYSFRADSDKVAFEDIPQTYIEDI
jgi:hypothetical protein